MIVDVQKKLLLWHFGKLSYESKIVQKINIFGFGHYYLCHLSISEKIGQNWSNFFFFLHNWQHFSTRNLIGQNVNKKWIWNWVTVPVCCHVTCKDYDLSTAAQYEYSRISIPLFIKNFLNLLHPPNFCKFLKDL